MFLFVANVYTACVAEYNRRSGIMTLVHTIAVDIARKLLASPMEITI
jgi:hypothetical protein